MFFSSFILPPSSFPVWGFPMSTDSADRQQQKVREFMNLLPLTLAVAGLSQAEPGKFFSEGQLDARSTTIRAAYKVARQIITEIASK